MNTAGLPQVRIATPADEPEVMTLVRELHDENGLFSLNEDKVRDCLNRCWRREKAIVGVIGEPGKIEASTCLIISDMYYTDDWHLAELWNYVAPLHRHSSNAQALIHFGRDCSDKIGIPLITGIITNTRVEEKVRLYRRMLGYPAGAFFVYGAKWNEAVEPTAVNFWAPTETRAAKRKRLRRVRRLGAA